MVGESGQEPDQEQKDEEDKNRFGREKIQGKAGSDSHNQGKGKTGYIAYLWFFGSLPVVGSLCFHEVNLSLPKSPRCTWIGTVLPDLVIFKMPR